MDEDLSALRAERDALRAELASRERRRRVGGAARAGVLAALVVVSVVAFVAATLGVWVERNVLDTDRYVDRVAPLAEDPAVQSALARRLTEEVMVLVDPAELFAEALPQRGAVLVAPMTGAVEDFVHERISGFLTTERFADLWRAANERAHRRVVEVLRGDGSRLEAAGDAVTIDLVPIINGVLAEIGEASPELLGRTVDLPTLTTDDLPGEARERLADAFGVSLDEDFGEITVYEGSKLEAAQEGLQAFERLRVASIAVTVAGITLALVISQRRRRTLLQLLAGIGLGLVLVRRIAITLQAEIVDLTPVEANQPAVEAVVSVFGDPLVAAAGWILLGSAALALLAIATAPYPWVVSTRGQVGRGARAVGGVLTGDGQGLVDQAWLGAHKDGVLVGGGALLGLVLWQSALSWTGALLAVALFGAFALAVDRLARPPSAEASSEASAEAGEKPAAKADAEVPEPAPIDLRVP